MEKLLGFELCSYPFVVVLLLIVCMLCSWWYCTTLRGHMKATAQT